MYNIVICDDEKALTVDLQQKLERYADEKGLQFQFHIYYDGKETLDHYRSDFDLIFMDIKMEQTDGLKAAQEIRRQDREVGLIFLTSVAKYVWKGYEFGAVNYLLKPLGYERLKMELDRFFAAYKGKEERFLTFSNDTGKYRIPYKDIRYFETSKRNVLVHYAGGQQLLYQSMKETAENMAEEDNFARCHVSFLVNMAYVRSVENLEAVLSTGEHIPVSHPKRKDFMGKLAEYWGNLL